MQIKENEVIELIKNGSDKQVISHLYKIVFPKVKNSIKRNNGSAEDAADVFQEAITYFYKRVISNTFNEKYTPYGFIYSMSINRWLNQIRKTKRISLKDNFDDIDLIETTEFEEKTSKVSDEKKELLQRFFKDLGETCIDLLHLSIFKSISYEDIAIRLELSNSNAVKMQIYRCKQRLLAAVNESEKLKNQLKALL